VKHSFKLALALLTCLTIFPSGANAQRKPMDKLPVLKDLGIKPVLTEHQVDPNLLNNLLAASQTCCAPAMSGTLAPQWAQAQSPGGNITSGYGLNFQPTTAFSNQLKAFVNYQKVLDPTFDALVMNVRVFDGGTGPTAVVTGGPIAQGQVMEWFENNPTPQALIQPVAPVINGPLQPNRWYVFETDFLVYTRPEYSVMQTNFGTTRPLDCDGQAFAYQVEYQVQKLGAGAPMPIGKAVPYDAPLPKLGPVAPIRKPSPKN
jgi:hypothetical protein